MVFHPTNIGFVFWKKIEKILNVCTFSVTKQMSKPSATMVVETHSKLDTIAIEVNN